MCIGFCDNCHSKICTAFVLPIRDSGAFLRLLRKVGSIAKTRISTGFACILEKFGYDCFGGRNLRVWFESYLRSQFFSKIRTLPCRLPAVRYECKALCTILPCASRMSADAASR
jgi:hypothetical protein